MFKINNSIQGIKWYQKINKRGSTRKIRKGEIINGKARVSSWHTKKLRNLKNKSKTWILVREWNEERKRKPLANKTERENTHTYKYAKLKMGYITANK